MTLPCGVFGDLSCSGSASQKALLIGIRERSEQEEGGNLKHNMDFRAVYSTILEDWLGMNPAPIVGGHYDKVQFL